MSITTEIIKRDVSRSALQKLPLFIFANVLLILCSYITIQNPLVPITLQTFGVCLVGIMLGAKAGALLVIIWLAEALIGLPVLSNGSSGIAAFSGKTAGYLFSFPLMAFITGQFYGKSLVRLFAGIVLAHAVCLIMGSGWLAILLNVSFAKALQIGCYPLLPGGLVKAAMLLAVVKAGQMIMIKYRRRQVSCQ